MQTEEVEQLIVYHRLPAHLIKRRSPSTHLIFIYCTNTPRLYGAICLLYTSSLFPHTNRGGKWSGSNDDCKAVFISGPSASDTGNIYLAGSGSVVLNCSNSCNTTGSFASPGFLPYNLFFPSSSPSSSSSPASANSSLAYSAYVGKFETKG